MIDMRGVDRLESYQKAKKAFQKKFPDNTECHDIKDCDKYWKLFKSSFLEKSKCKCPICENCIDNYHDIDHYRPEEKYPFLKCCCTNYMVMCKVCNSKFKSSNFPINGQKATSLINLSNEQPLLINPRTDNILEYFDLLFIRRKSGKLVLELSPKKGLDSFKKERAEKTIEIYGLGNCDQNPKIDGCRINVLEKHYESFIKLAKAKVENMNEFIRLKQDPDLQKKLEYGFISFIENDQFRIIGT